MIVLLGVLAQPPMLEVLSLSGTPVAIGGALRGGRQAGITRSGWPALVASEGSVAGIAVAMTDVLARYAAVMGLTARDWHGQAVMGVAAEGPG